MYDKDFQFEKNKRSYYEQVINKSTVAKWIAILQKSTTGNLTVHCILILLNPQTISDLIKKII